MVGIGLRDFDDEAGLAANNLFRDTQVGAQLGATKPLGENAGNLEAGGTVAHRRCYLGFGVDGQSIRTAMPGRTSGDGGLFNCANTL